jgi:hypothetical protein
MEFAGKLALAFPPFAERPLIAQGVVAALADPIPGREGGVGSGALFGSKRSLFGAISSLLLTKIPPVI